MAIIIIGLHMTEVIRIMEAWGTSILPEFPRSMCDQILNQENRPTQIFGYQEKIHHIQNMD